MFIPIFIASIILHTNATSIVSRSQSHSLSQPGVLGPQTSIIIGNKVIAPDGFERSATLVDGTFPGPLIAAQKGDRFSIEVVNELMDDAMFKSTSVCDGLKGPLVIYDPHDPLAYMYDIDDVNTIITLSDWYHSVAPVLRGISGLTPNSTLINGHGRYTGGPMSELAVISVERGKRYRMRLIAMACYPNYLFSIDGHNLTVIEADGQLTEPLVVDQLQIYAGQRYSVVLVADMAVDNYWIRALPNLVNSSYEGGVNTAILRYNGAPKADPTTTNTTVNSPLQETNLHALINPGPPGVPGYGKADINVNLTVTTLNGIFYVNGIQFRPPTVPVLLQILSGAQEPSQLLPNGSVVVLEANKIVELTLASDGAGVPHPMHLHGHAVDVVQSAGNSTFNYVNPVRRDVVNAGAFGEQMVIRWITDNSGPWFLHCHIDWHLDTGFAVVMAESPSDTRAHLNLIPSEWDQLCPIFDSLSPSQLGGRNHS
ncbi:hypothetical protein AZE42_05804 [Rhizopogon vesiculosus]|uniref:laccase n=1 Tax=Rhizopogon vesiculosus TaxID=180088 RepID=A0A1J8R9M1_9AGAM|nr:hypothetical protein AZE42_05804 [Rhizopogon vesiculosus]